MYEFSVGLCLRREDAAQLNEMVDALRRLVNLSEHPYFPPSVATMIPAWPEQIARAREALAHFQRKARADR